MKKERGIALITLVIIIVAIGIVIYSGAKYANQYYRNQKNEDIKANMLAIQTVITNIENLHIVNETENPLVGQKLELENYELNYNINEELKQILNTEENPNLYILNTEELNKYGIKDVIVNEEEFYIVDYNAKEIFYSKGINGQYKLSEM